MSDKEFDPTSFLNQINLPAELLEQSPTLVIILYFLFKMLPILISGLSIFLGYRLFILGVSGQASIILDTSTIKGQLINAAPGLVFAVGGIVALIVIVFTGVDISLTNTNTG